jgi:hypothetical protein
MGLLNLLNPKTFYETFLQIVKNISNRNFYRKTMKTLEKNGSLKQLGMRLDMRGRAYYVLNLEPETLMMGMETLELEKSRVLESISLKKSTFETAGLAELIEAQTDRIKTEEYYAYLIQIKYRKIANWLDLVYVITWAAIASFLIYWIVQGALNYQAIATAIDNLLHQK